MMLTNHPIDAVASGAYSLALAGRGVPMEVDYVSPKYRLAEAAFAADVPLNTLRSYYQRGDFRIVGGEEKKGRGIAALLNVHDVMCIAVACKLIGVGVKAKPAFQIGMKFAYFGNDARLPSHMYKSHPFTVLISYPPDALESRIIGVDESILFEDLFAVSGAHGRLPPVLVLLNDVERRVFWALHLSGPQYDPIGWSDADGN